MEIKFFKNKATIYLLILCFLTIVFSAIFNETVEFFSFSLIVPIILLFFSFVFYQFNHNLNSNQYVSKLILHTFILKLVSIIVFTEILNYYVGIPFLSKKDDYSYYYSALGIVKKWNNNGISIVKDIQFSTGFYSGYPNISALVMYLFGESIFVLKFFNSIFSSFIIIFYFKLMQLYCSDKSIKITLSIIAFSPLIIYFSSFVLKDILLLLFTITSIYCFAKIILDKSNFKTIILLIFSFIMLVFFRAATLVPIISSFIIVYLIKFFSLKKAVSIKSLFLILFTLLIFLKLWDYISTLNLISDYESYYLPRIEHYSSKEVFNSGTNAGKLAGISVFGAPILILTSLFLPAYLFINLGNFETINYQASSMIYHIAFVPFLFSCFIYLIRNIKKLKSLILFFLFTILFMKLGQVVSINSLFSARQSLGSIFIFYLILPIYLENKHKMKFTNWYFIFAIFVLFGFNISRYLIRL